MKNKLVATFSSLSINRLFLIDAVGALLSAIMLGIVLPQFHHHIGLPVVVLRLLAIPAFFFFLYSATCFILHKSKKSSLLKLISIANILYALITLSILIYNFDEILWLGWLYFIGEVLIVVILAIQEWSTAIK